MWRRQWRAGAGGAAGALLAQGRAPPRGRRGQGGDGAAAGALGRSSLTTLPLHHHQGHAAGAVVPHAEASACAGQPPRATGAAITTVQLCFPFACAWSGLEVGLGKTRAQGLAMHHSNSSTATGVATRFPSRACAGLTETLPRANPLTDGDTRGATWGGPRAAWPDPTRYLGPLGLPGLQLEEQAQTKRRRKSPRVLITNSRLTFCIWQHVTSRHSEGARLTQAGRLCRAEQGHLHLGAEPTGGGWLCTCRQRGDRRSVVSTHQRETQRHF